MLCGCNAQPLEHQDQVAESVSPPAAQRRVKLFIEATTWPDWRVQVDDGEPQTSREVRSKQGDTVTVLLRSDRVCVVEIPGLAVRRVLPSDRYQRLWITTNKAGEFEMRIHGDDRISVGRWLVE